MKKRNTKTKKYGILRLAPSGFTLDGGREAPKHGLLSLLCRRGKRNQQELPQEEQGDRWQHLSHKEPHLQEPLLLRSFVNLKFLSTFLDKRNNRLGSFRSNKGFPLRKG